MASTETIKKIFAMVFFKFPGRSFKDPEEAKIVKEVWENIFRPISDEAVLNALKNFVTSTEKLFPDDDPFSIIFNMANSSNCETPGDAWEIIFSAASKFGTQEPKKAMEWIKSKSPLIASVIRRFGYETFCLSTNQDFTRSQIFTIFKAEKERAIRTGIVLDTAEKLTAGNLPLMLETKEAKLLSDCKPPKTRENETK